MTDDQFEELLNVINDPITVFGIEFDAGTAIRKLDQIAFQQLKTNYEEYMK